MSYKFYTFGKNAKRNQEGRSRKGCICGGHNATNVKRNLHHNSTLNRLYIKRNRRFKQKLMELVNE